ncbi:NAD(P)/FAD-dependent oxidoreductase [Polynucleobacter sp. AP-Nino-20-G2]|uniref:NAD(P)/FAD-dependent oxidoreductase n=1 Tax=Polynucleobacter sp. AP-Nino-20-G2 TaxID=2576917 RepID=UPI001BFE0429|nr:FAD-dependent oxidoreductase [Polynucleobacter sp. AP-Nino-20-G2]QWE16239.1 FAD-dependent oxidoreductase [Polynucleobacter sp. AP-Nino-20-G2]
MNKDQRKTISVAIIGAGIAGLSCATRLKALGFTVQIYEKSRGVSGRMSTRKADDWSADHGAQYFTARDSLFIEEVNQWVDTDAAAIWNPRLRVYEAKQWRESVSSEHRYVGTPAMNSIGKHLARNLPIEFNQTIDRIAYNNSKWLLHSLEAGDIEQQFDWLVIALPAPQAQALAKSSDKSIEEIAADANMLGCWTVIANFAEKSDVPFDAAFINDEIISWISRNNSKPNRTGMETWTIHANPQWSQEWIELEKDEAAKRILNCAKTLGLDCDQAIITIHRWRYASGHINCIPGFRFREDLKIGFCGDWLHGGRVEGAWLSGHKLASQIANS